MKAFHVSSSMPESTLGRSNLGPLGVEPEAIACGVWTVEAWMESRTATTLASASAVSNVQSGAGHCILIFSAITIVMVSVAKMKNNSL
jgi:hypothetical protein